MSSDPSSSSNFGNLADNADLSDIKDRLTETFGSVDKPVDARQHPDRWDKLWKDNFLPWDKYVPGPALIEAINVLLLGKPLDPPREADDDKHPDTILPGTSVRLPDPVLDSASSTTGTRRRRRALVPGCGRGYDVFFLASAGYDAVGLDVSSIACDQANNLYKSLEESGWEGYPLLRPDVSRGNVEFRAGDFFSNEWETEDEKANGWDLIYDYTFLCALPPTLRPGWSNRMTTLLAPTGSLLCVEFPTAACSYIRPGSGPPWVISPAVYRQHLANPGVELQYGDDTGQVIAPEKKKPCCQDGARPCVCVAHWKARKTHERGVGIDCISLFRLKCPGV